MTNILVVLSGSDHWTLADGTKHPSGYWAEEFVVPHKTFREAGFDVTIATPGGVTPTVDKASLTPEMNGGDQGRAEELRDYIDSLRGELDSTMRLEDVNPGDFDGLFIPGGHGPMEDLAVSEALGVLLVGMLDSGKVVSGVCHGPSGLFAAKRADGSWAFAGYRLTGFTNVEEDQVGFADKAQWLLETRLREEGAEFASGAPWAPYVVTDRNLVTGQNPASSEPIARQLVDMLSASA
ncbi:type 1 glutamine amidotransferase domain-containing protein [Streptomyces thermocarboxydovorans]